MDLKRFQQGMRLCILKGHQPTPEAFRVFISTNHRKKNLQHAFSGVQNEHHEKTDSAIDQQKKLRYGVQLTMEMQPNGKFQAE
jgi:hypothetical protein